MTQALHYLRIGINQTLCKSFLRTIQQPIFIRTTGLLQKCYQKSSLHTCQSQYFIKDLWHYDIYTLFEIEQLKDTWDPAFDIDDFKYGVQQALLTIIPLICHTKWAELRGLLRLDTLEKLSQEKDVLVKLQNFSSISSANVTRTDIVKVTLQEIVDQKYCDIEVRFKIVGGSPIEGYTIELPYAPGIFETAFFLRFHRNYSRGKIPEWTITKFTIGKQKT